MAFHIDIELIPVDTAAWFPKIARKDYTLGPNITCGAVDDPDQNFYENYACGSARPILYHNKAATCWQPALHGITPMVNSVYNWPRFENAWLDR